MFAVRLFDPRARVLAAGVALDDEEESATLDGPADFVVQLEPDRERLVSIVRGVQTIITRLEPSSLPYLHHSDPSKLKTQYLSPYHSAF